MKNIISITFTLVLGVVGAWGQGIQTFTAGRWQSPSVEGSTNSIPIAVQDNAVVFYRVNHGVTVNISATSGGANINASGRTGAQPAIFLPESATLVITGDGTINLTGGNGADGVEGKLLSNDGGDGGGGAAPGIGGKGGTGGQGGITAGNSKYGTLGTGMGKLYILGNVTVNVKKGKEGVSKVGTTVVGGGDGGKTPQYAIGGGGRGGNSKDGESSASSSPYYNQTPNNGYIFIQNTATVTYKNGQGATDTSRPDVQTEPTLKALSDVGYTFTGYRVGETWVVDENGIYVDGGSGFDKSISVLDERWTKTITLDQQGGTGGNTSVEVAYGCSMKAATAPSRTGYTFMGYFTEPNGGGTQYYDADMSSTHNWDINTNQNTLYAKWTVKQYTVNLDKQGGTGGTSSVTVNYDSAMPSATAPSRTGYTFKGYYSEQNGGGTQYYAEDMNSAHNWDIDTNPSTLYAKWEANKCTINLDKQGGSGGTAYVTGTYDSAMPSATAPSRTGYTFAGYYTSPNGGGTQYYDENMVSVSYWHITTNPSTLYANWTANTYTLNFDVQNGDALSPSTQSVTYDAAYGTMPTPTRYGFAFKGWYTTPNGGSETDTEVLTSDIYSIDGDQTIYAHWNTIVVDIDAYSAETQLAGNYFRTFYDSQIAHILPTGVKAYKGKIEGNNLVLTAIEAKDDDDNDIIPKNVPVILRMMPNEEAGVPIPGNIYQIKTKQISLTTSESELTIDNTDNELIGSDIVIATAVTNSYILSFGSNGLGFYEWSTHPLEAHKAYVIKDSANPAKALTFRFEEDVTGINETIKDFMFNDSNMVIYNLNGIRLSKPQKGLNIINGRKVWVK